MARTDVERVKDAIEILKSAVAPGRRLEDEIIRALDAEAADIERIAAAPVPAEQLKAAAGATSVRALAITAAGLIAELVGDDVMGYFDRSAEMAHFADIVMRLKDDGGPATV